MVAGRYQSILVVRGRGKGYFPQRVYGIKGFAAVIAVSASALFPKPQQCDSASLSVAIPDAPGMSTVLQGEAQSAGGQLGENAADNFIVRDNCLTKKNFPLVINFHCTGVNDFPLLGEAQHMLGGKAQFGAVAAD